MDLRDLMNKLDQLNEAANPRLYADAQQMMANLEKAAQYTGDDEIVRSRMGLPPKLPPIEQWDGKMPAPIGKPDWAARLFTMGKATDDQATAVKQNTAISNSRQFITTNMAKLKELVDKLQATTQTPIPETSIADELLESFGYLTEKPAMVNSPEYQANYDTIFGKKPAAPATNFSQGGYKSVTTNAPTTVPSVKSPVAANLEKAGVKTVAPDAAKAAIKASGGKMLTKLLPGVGLVFGTADAISRAKEGDWTGAGMAGLSAVLSLGGPLTAAAAMGLDAANIARDYKAGKFSGTSEPEQGTKPSGDAKLTQLQKLIGAEPDGIYGPETKEKLKAWQQKQGIAVDGIPGPETYSKAGIKEQTVAEGILSLQKRLSLIETKSTIKESLEEKYFLDEDFMIVNEAGDYVTDLVTLSVIAESSDIELTDGILSSIKDFVGGAFKGSKSPAAATKLAQRASTTGAKKAGLKTGAAVGRNPVKAGLGATAIGGAAGLALGDKPTQPTEPVVPTGSGQSQMPVSEPDQAPEPVAPVGPTPEQTDLVKQIQALMSQLADVDEPEVAAELSRAQTAIDSVSK